MATWTSISNAAVAVGGIPSSSTVTALRDNPTALAETASGAPVVFAGWHPVDKVTIGDGKDGLIYDHAVTGTVSEIDTPDFADGYEYRIIGCDLESNSASNGRLNLYAYFETDGWERLRYSTDGAESVFYFGCDLEIVTPRISKYVHLANGWMYRQGSISNDGIDSTSYQFPRQKLLKARLVFTNGSIDGGKVYLFRRREYATLP
jgi:hypothetical protein